MSTERPLKPSTCPVHKVHDGPVLLLAKSQHYTNAPVESIHLGTGYLKVVHQAVLTAALLADGEVVAQCAGGIGAVHRVAHRVVVVAGRISHDARAWRRRKTSTV